MRRDKLQEWHYSMINLPDICFIYQLMLPRENWQRSHPVCDKLSLSFSLSSLSHTHDFFLHIYSQHHSSNVCIVDISPLSLIHRLHFSFEEEKKNCCLKSLFLNTKIFSCWRQIFNFFFFSFLLFSTKHKITFENWLLNRRFVFFSSLYREHFTNN